MAAGTQGGRVSLWLCLRFPQLPLQCQTLDETQPIVVLEQQRVLRANDCASAMGVHIGMAAAGVRALAAELPLQLRARDTAAEQHCLQQLCCWAYGISPRLYIWQEDCLQLEIGSCLTLHRGLNTLLRTVRHGIEMRGYRVDTGLAPTPKAAWLLSFHAEGSDTDNPEAWQEHIAGLPLALLQEFPKAVTALERAGLRYFSDILTLPEAALAKRCGQGLVHYLRQMLGRATDLEPDYQPPQQFSDQYWFGYEAKTTAELLPAVEQLLQSLCGFLRQTQLQSGQIDWQLLSADRQKQHLQVRSSSRHSDWATWYQLTRLQLDRLTLRSGVEGLVLECKELLAGHSAAIDLFSPRNQREPLHALLDRLRSRLGLQAIHTISCRDEHLPELAVYLSTEPSAQPTAVPPGAQRPFWLLPEPQPLARKENGALYWYGQLQLVRGPERIEDRWWQEPVSRDYYIARGHGGQYYWLFHDRRQRCWYLHGLFA
ncbi:MAG: DNA polymerase Y family protein [Haliea sp.]|nr:DNA polymerase Y family protein [Haliea sp.]